MYSHSTAILRMLLQIGVYSFRPKFGGLSVEPWVTLLASLQVIILRPMAKRSGQIKIWRQLCGVLGHVAQHPGPHT